MLKEMRTGYSTGACAAAAAKAAALMLRGAEAVESVEITMPDGKTETFAVAEAAGSGPGRARAAVRKYSGDDPDVTNGMTIAVEIETREGGEIIFAAGDGVGMVTKPGLSIPPGEPAINPTPRRMIREALSGIISGGAVVTVSIPGGREVAEKTFNPRLGIVGGLSVLGTTGRVIPYSHPALRDALKCGLDVAQATGIKAPAFVPGNIGRRAAEKYFDASPEQVVEAGNEWGWMLEQARGRGFERALIAGHPGKLAKLPMGNWDTHSGKSASAVEYVNAMIQDICGATAGDGSATVEGALMALGGKDRRAVGDALAERICAAAAEKVCGEIEFAALLVNMAGEIIGAAGDMSAWKRRSE